MDNFLQWQSKQAGVHCIPNRVSIEERPAIVDEKLRSGHWESDTVISPGSRCALLRLVERHSNYVIPDLVANYPKHALHSLQIKDVIWIPDMGSGIIPNLILDCPNGF
jgi:IS30 family transposase